MVSAQCQSPTLKFHVKFHLKIPICHFFQECQTTRSAAKQHCSWTLRQVGCCAAGWPTLTMTPCGSRDSAIKDLKDCMSFSITSVIIIDYHQHSHCLLPAVAGCQNIKVSFSSNCSPSFLISSNCCLHLLLFVVLPSSSFPSRNFPRISSEWGIISSSSTVIVAIAVVVFTSLPPAETRTSNTQASSLQ